MMQANELRIGNWILVDNKITSVEAITELSVTTFNDVEIILSKIGNVKPIHLTEEILLKCGFEVQGDREWLCIKINKQSELCFSLQDKIVTSDVGIWKIEDEGCDNNGWINIKCDYLHQLQNLLFALNGQELTINEI